MIEISLLNFVLDFNSMMHLSRISEEFIIWSSEEFEFIELSDDVVTTSSMMPQKEILTFRVD